MQQSQKRLLEKLRSTPAEDLTAEDLEDLEELEQLEKKEKEDQEKEEKEKDPDPVADFTKIDKTLEEILKCLKPQENPNPQEQVEIPTPPPVVTNQQLEDQEQEDQPIQESKLKKILKSIW